jgi:predicted Zn finger-like uncharacterized protein
MMDYLFERVAYLQGLADGLGLDESSKEGKLLLKMVEVLDDFADAIVELDEEVAELEEFIDIIDEDLSDLEEFIYDEEFDYDYDFDEFECPNCGTVIYVDEDDFDASGNVELACPECNEEYVITDDIDNCCCDCDCEEVEEKE